MNVHREAINVTDILSECSLLQAQDAAFLQHPIIQRFGSLQKPVYIEQGNVDINGVTYEQPLIMPVYDGQLELVQCAVMQDGLRVAVIPDGLAKGFARHGDFNQSKPVIVTYSLEAFFKISQTEYAVALVVLPTLCNAPYPEKQLKEYDFAQIQFVINQLANAGYTELYLPVRPEHLELFKHLEKNKVVRLFNHYQPGFECDLSQYDDVEDVKRVLDISIEALSSPSIQWPEPLPIKSELLPVNTLTSDMLPKDIDDYCRDEAKRADNMNPDFVSICIITSLGALIGSRVAVKPKQKDEFAVVPNLWGGIVAPPSSKKTPAIKAGTRHLDRLVLKAKDAYEQDKRQCASNMLVAKSTEKELLKSLDKAKDPLEKEQIAMRIAEMHEQSTTQPVLKRYFTNDSTPEALADLERSNTNGILVIRDELIGLLSSLDQNDTDTGRAFYLEGWNGTGSYQFDRIIRGSGFIQNHCLSVLGGIQPDKLFSYLEKSIKGLGNDGLLQRFQLLIYPDSLQWQYVDEYIDKDVREAVFNLFNAIDNLSEKELVEYGAFPSDEFNPRPYFRFGSDAQEVYKAWSIRLNSEVIPNEEHPILQEHLSKFGKLMPSLALIFHLVDCVQLGEKLGGISKRCTVQAIQWCDYLETHARRIYGMVLHSAFYRAGELAKRLKALDIDDPLRLAEGFNERQLRRREWKNFTEMEAIHDALDVLVEKFWLKVEVIGSTSKGGRPTKRYFINPKIYKC